MIGSAKSDTASTLTSMVTPTDVQIDIRVHHEKRKFQVTTYTENITR